jgi:hypothetical protein
MKLFKFITVLSALFFIACNKNAKEDSDLIIKTLNNEPAIVREITFAGANVKKLFVLELRDNYDGLYSSLVIPNNALPAEYQKNELPVILNGNVINRTIVVDDYILDTTGNSQPFKYEYNQIELTTIKYDAEYEDGNVPFAPCLCEGQEQQLAGIAISQSEAYLFKDSIPKQIEKNIQRDIHLPENKDGVKWIIYDSQTDIAYLYNGIHAILQICKICNYPDFAKKWDIPQNGQLVYFNGITYQACNPPGGIATVSYFDFVLTHLKIK